MEETAQTLDRGLRLLRFLAETPGGMTVSEAASRLGVGRTVVYRLAATLAGHGMIRRDAAGQLRIGAGVLHLARQAQPLIADAALPALRRLAEQVGATAHLTVAELAGRAPESTGAAARLDGRPDAAGAELMAGAGAAGAGGPDRTRAVPAGEAVALAVVEPSWTQFHVAYRTGSRHPLDRGAAGQAILAGRRGESGWIETAGQLQAGAYGIAAPVPGVPGLEASVGVIALAELDATTVGPAVVAAAQAVARAFG